MSEPERPLLRVVRGTPDDAELAALALVVTSLAAAGGGQQREATRRSTWADPAYRMRTPLRPGPGAWRASALPH